MSRLHDPGPGEILDRLTILARKLVEGWLKRVTTAHWAEEYAALTAASPGWTGVLDLVLELAAVNAALWQAEDELRRLREQDVPHQGVGYRLAVRIQQLNDRRAELITLINTHAGINRGPEKLI